MHTAGKTDFIVRVLQEIDVASAELRAIRDVNRAR